MARLHEQHLGVEVRGILEKLMLELMYEIPSSEDVASVKITRSVVRDDGKPIIRRKEKQAAA